MKPSVIIIIFITLLISNSIEINSTSYDDWVYINFGAGGPVLPGDSPEDNPGWDIACQRYHFKTNSGLSGNGLGGAYVDSIATWTSNSYSSLIQVPNNTFFEKDTIVNTFYNVIDEDGDGIEEHIFGLSGIANPSLETWGWIDINNNYVMNYTDNQFIVRNGVGDRFYKIWAVNYYNDNGTSGYIQIYFAEIAECSDGIDECGECGGDDSSCSGCIDDTACNYDIMASVNFGCEYPLDNYDCDGICIASDNDSDGICNEDDICPNNWDPYQHDRDQDGLPDACLDDDDDGDNLKDCWDYWYYDGILLSDEQKNNLIDAEECQDIALGSDNIFMLNNFSLLQNYPNPFNPSTIIEYSIREPSNILIDIFDIRSRNILTLEDDFKNIGNHTVYWDGINSDSQRAPSGIYVYRLVANGLEIDRKKMLLLY